MENPDGTVNKYKAHLVTKSFHQQLGFDYNDTLTTVIKQTTTRVILTLAITHKWELQQVYINNAFLNGILQEEVYTVQPPGFISFDKTLV